MAIDQAEFNAAMAVYLAATDHTIALRRGLASALPAGLLLGEPYYATDTENLHIGHGDGTNIMIVNRDDADADIATMATGWTARTETFAYASATTITVATGAAARWQTGDMIKFTQHGSVKYFYIVTVADTLLTVIGNGAVVVEDTATYAITLINYSRHGRPFGFPQWFTYTPVYSASGSMTFTKTANQSEKFTLVGKTVLMELSAGGTTGGTTSDQILVTVPIAFTSATANVFGGGAFAYDAAFLGGSWTNADATHIAIRKYDGSNWALAASKYFSVNFSYDIA